MPDALDHLTRLIALNHDSEAGFNTAAENVNNTELETVFSGYAKQHAKFARELEQEVGRAGGNASDAGTLGGAIHRNWLDLKAALTGHSAAGILESCRSGEESAEVAYDEATRDISTGQTYSLLTRQRQHVNEIRTRLARLVQETKDGVEFQANKEVKS